MTTKAKKVKMRSKRGHGLLGNTNESPANAKIIEMSIPIGGIIEIFLTFRTSSAMPLFLLMFK